MPFTRHTLQEIKEGNLRARCTLCGQTWTSYHVRSACPGVPVYPFEELPPYLKTLTALERERKYPPDVNHWDGAYRILKASYYRLVYDERTAIHKPLTEKQLAAKEKREQAIHEKHTCRVCGTFYTGRYDRRDFFNGVCNTCRYEIKRYNDQITWARALRENGAIMLDIRTEPEVHPYTDEVEQPLLTGFTALDLESGDVFYEADMRNREDLQYIKHLVCPDYSALEPYPSVLTLYPSALHVVRFELERNAKSVYLFNPNLTEVLVSAHVEYVLVNSRPVSVYGWNDPTWFKGWTACQALDYVCSLHGIDESLETTAALMRKLVLHLAVQEPLMIELAEA